MLTGRGEVFPDFTNIEAIEKPPFDLQFHEHIKLGSDQSRNWLAGRNPLPGFLICSFCIKKYQRQYLSKCSINRYILDTWQSSSGWQRLPSASAVDSSWILGPVQWAVNHQSAGATQSQGLTFLWNPRISFNFSVLGRVVVYTSIFPCFTSQS